MAHVRFTVPPQGEPEIIECDGFESVTLKGWTMSGDLDLECECGQLCDPDQHHCPECGSMNPFRTIGMI